MTQKTSKKGGARPGAGRPKKSVGRDIVQVKLHIYADQRETLKNLGGSDWLQKTLDSLGNLEDRMSNVIQFKPSSKIKDRIQSLVDDFYFANGPCCAGCDFWQWHNSAVGDCTKSAPVSAEQRFSMISPDASILPSAGHIVTPRDHWCGDFKDGFDWAKIGKRPPGA